MGVLSLATCSNVTALLWHCYKWHVLHKQSKEHKLSWLPRQCIRWLSLIFAFVTFRQFQVVCWKWQTSVLLCVLLLSKERMVCNSAYGPVQFWVHLTYEEPLHFLIFLMEDEKNWIHTKNVQCTMYGGLVTWNWFESRDFDSILIQCELRTTICFMAMVNNIMWLK